MDHLGDEARHNAPSWSIDYPIRHHFSAKVFFDVKFWPGVQIVVRRLPSKRHRRPPHGDQHKCEDQNDKDFHIANTSFGILRRSKIAMLFSMHGKTA